MKYSCFIALLGLAQAYHPSNVYYFQNKSDSESETDEDADLTNILLKERKDYFTHWENGFGGYHTYIRDIPDRFEEEKDDRLMHSLYTQYAYEGKTDGKPNGHFYLNHANGRAVSREVVMTHLGMDGKAADSYLDSEFEPLWRKYDVLEDGKVDIDRMPQFLRQICGSAEGCIGLQ